MFPVSQLILRSTTDPPGEQACAGRAGANRRAPATTATTVSPASRGDGALTRIVAPSSLSVLPEGVLEEGERRLVALRDVVELLGVDADEGFAVAPADDDEGILGPGLARLEGAGVGLHHPDDPGVRRELD